MKNILVSDIYLDDLKLVAEKLPSSLLNGKRFLITGGSGLICSAIIDVLLMHELMYSSSITIYAPARKKSHFEEKYDKYRCVKYVEYDAAKNIEFDINADYIIHGASLSSPELYIGYPVETMRTVYHSTENLLEYSKNHRIGRMLYISSSEVYGRQNKLDPLCESDIGTVDISTVRSSYSEAKRAAEVLCRAYFEEYGLDTVIVRPGHVFGPTARQTDKRLSSSFAYDAAFGRPLVLKSSGLQKRSYCYCLDCAYAVLTVLLKGKSSESYNIGHSDVTTILELSKMLSDIGDVPLIMGCGETHEIKRFNPMDNSSLDISKILTLGYNDIFSVRDGLEHTVRIIKNIYGNSQA